MDMYDKIDWKEPILEGEDNSSDDSDDCYISKYIAGTFSPAKDVDIETNFENARVTNQNQLPKVPGSQFYFSHNRTSKFNVDEHRTFINALKVLKSGRKNINYFEKRDIEAYNYAKAQILLENKEFLALAEENWKVTFGMRPLRIKPTIGSYATRLRMHKLLGILKEPSFYKAINLLPFSYDESETPIEMVHTANVLDVGTVAKFLPPTLKQHFVLKVSTLPTFEYNPTASSRLPITEDKNIEWIHDKHHVDVVIAFSALKRLINYSDHAQMWEIPVVIKEIPRKDKRGEEKMEKVIYIKKPLPPLQPTILDLNELCSKRMMKTNFCCVEAFTYESEDINVTNETEKKEEVPEKSTTEISSQKIILNRFYKLWSLKPKEEDTNCMMKKTVKSREFGVLIRGKVDGCEVNENGTLQAITVIPKMEFQLAFGGTIFTRRELSNQWTQLYFKPYSNLYRVRAHNFSNEVITMEPINIEHVKNESLTQYNYKPQLGIGALYKLFYELIKYPPGNYSMKYEPKHGAFIAFYKEVGDEESSDYNLHKTFKTDGKIVTDYVKTWTPIDPTILLPKYELEGHMPGLFKPKQVKNKTGVPNGKNGVKKKKNKKKSAARIAKRALMNKMRLEAEKSEY